MAKKQNLRFAIVVLAAFVLAMQMGLLSGFSSAFLSSELNTKTIVQNGQTVTFLHSAFLNDELVSGNVTFALETSGRSNSCQYGDMWPTIQRCWEQDICGQGFFLDDAMTVYANGTKIAEYPLTRGFTNPPNFNSAFPIDFSIALPQAIKDIGGNVELRFYKDSYAFVCMQNDSLHQCTVPTFATINYSVETQGLCGHSFHGNTLYYSNGADPMKHQLLVVSNVYIEPSVCTSSSYVTYEQVFKQGTTLRVQPQNSNETGFRIGTPAFCHTAPILKMSMDSNQVFAQSNIEYDSLSNGGYVTVPSGEQWIVFYRGAPAISDIIQCENQNGVWNATDNRCELPPTLYYVCNGIVTTQSECITTATDYRCLDPTAQLVMLEDGSSVCRIYLNQVTYLCPVGSTLTVDGNGNQTCISYPTVLCNGVPLPTGGSCTSQAETTYFCPSNATLQTNSDGSHICVSMVSDISYVCPIGTTLDTLPDGTRTCASNPVVTCNGMPESPLNPCTVETSNYACADPNATLQYSGSGSPTCISVLPNLPTMSGSCPAGATLKTNSSGVNYCEYAPQSVCADGSQPINGKCTSQILPLEGAIGGTGNLLLIVGVVLVGGFIAWNFIKKR